METNNNNIIINKFYNIITNKKVLIVSFIATTILTLILNRIESLFAGENGAGNLMLQLAFSKENFEIIIASWGLVGVNLFLKSMWIDFLYVISYTTLFLSAPVYFHNLRNKKISKNEQYNLKLFLIPLAEGFFDIIENVFQIIIITQRMFFNEIIFVSSIVSSVKWLLFIVSLGIILMKYFEMRKS